MKMPALVGKRYPGAGRRGWLVALLFLTLSAISSSIFSQQFNTDNWWVLTHGVGLGVANVGQNYSSMYLGYGFAPKWEADVAITIFDENSTDEAAAHYSTTAYVKRLLHENEAETGGVAVMAGIGQSPGYYQSGIKIDKFASYWAGRHFQ
jgi:hypothetical protein